MISSGNSEFVFTEHGVTKLSSVLRSDVAMLTGKKANVSVTIYTSEKNCRITEQESKSFNNQYGPFEISLNEDPKIVDAVFKRL